MIRDRLIIAAAVAAVAAGLAGCGAGDNAADDDDDVQDANTGDQDAASGSDGGVPCSAVIDLSTTTPAVGDTVTAYGNIDDPRGASSYHWTIEHGEDPVIEADTRDVTFPITSVGTYYIRLNVISDFDFCDQAQVQLRVEHPGANVVPYRLRLTPTAAQPFPPQEFNVLIPGGAPYDRTVVLDEGTEVNGLVVDQGSVPVAAYLRFVPRDQVSARIESFASSTGTFSVRTRLADHDVLIVPASSDYAPVRIAEWTPLDRQLVVPAAAEVTGTVRGPDNQPLAGARVRLTIAGVPSTAGLTGADGSFRLLARPGGAVDVVVSGPDDAPAVPDLVVTGVALDLGEPLTITYAATATRAVGGATVAAGATVSFVGERAAGGAIGGHAAIAQVRARVVATAAGVLPALVVPTFASLAIVEPPGAAAGAVALDLTAGSPATLTIPAAGQITGTVAGPDIIIRAVATGPLAAAAAAASTESAADGSFTLTLPGGDRYDLVATDPRGQWASSRRTGIALAAGATVALGAWELPSALSMSGRVLLPDVPINIRFASLQLFCDACTGRDAELPIAEAITDRAGRYAIAVPDPGITEPTPDPAPSAP